MTDLKISLFLFVNANSIVPHNYIVPLLTRHPLSNKQ